jgi:hypothetical protein
MVDVVGTDTRPEEFLEEIVFFVGASGRCQTHDRI